MICLRLGDNAEYESFDDIDRVIDEMKSLNISGPFKRWGTYGIECPGFEQMNYISIYHGDSIEGPLSPINDEEFNSLKEALC